jgi:hypothetical protein
MAAPVVVQGLPEAADLRAAVLLACSDALKHRACISGDEPEGGAAAPYATAVIVLPDGTDRHVRIALERFDATPVRLMNRETRFADEDPIVERWRTVGLVIAALVGEAEAPLESATEPEDRLSPGRAARGSAPWIGVSALAGPGLDDGSVRLGAVVHGAIVFRPSPVFLVASLGHALRPLDEQKLDVRWTTFAVGGGARAVVPHADLGLRLRLEVLLEYLQASSSSGAAVSGGGSQLSPGLRGGAEAIWPASGTLAVTLGFSVWSLPGGTAIRLDQRELGSSPWLSYAGLLGGQWSFR